VALHGFRRAQALDDGIHGAIEQQRGIEHAGGVLGERLGKAGEAMVGDLEPATVHEQEAAADRADPRQLGAIGGAILGGELQLLAHLQFTRLREVTLIEGFIGEYFGVVIRFRFKHRLLDGLDGLR